MKHNLLLASVLCASTLFISPSAQAGDIMYLLQSRAGMTETRVPTTIPYSYTMHVHLSQLDSDGHRTVQAELRIDPSKPPGSRARLKKFKGLHREVLTEFLQQIENPERDMAALAGNFWCSSIHDNEEVDLSTYTVVSESDTEAMLIPNPDKLAEMLLQRGYEDMDKSQRKMKEKLLDRVEGHIIVSQRNGGTKGIKVDMTRSTTIKKIAKFTDMSLEQSCAIAPNGYRYKSNEKSSLKGSALFQGFSHNEDIRIYDLRPLP